jgi:hypothetical protein
MTRKLARMTLLLALAATPAFALIGCDDNDTITERAEEAADEAEDELND